jgi:fibronectin type 3 domain-containing protein
VNTATASLGTNTATITVIGGGITRTVSVTLALNAPSTSSATLTWNANTESDVVSYRVYRSTTQGVYVGGPVATVPAGATNYLSSGLQTLNTYYFIVTAVDSAGNESLPSAEVSKSIF